MSRVLELSTCCAYVYTLVFSLLLCVCVWLHHGFCGKTDKSKQRETLSTNMPDGGALCWPAGNASAVPPIPSQRESRPGWWPERPPGRVERFLLLDGGDSCPTPAPTNPSRRVPGQPLWITECRSSGLIRQLHLKLPPAGPALSARTGFCQVLRRSWRGRHYCALAVLCRASLECVTFFVLFVSFIFFPTSFFYYALYFLVYNSLRCLELLFIPLYYGSVRLCIPRSISGMFHVSRIVFALFLESRWRSVWRGRWPRACRFNTGNRHRLW